MWVTVGCVDSDFVASVLQAYGGIDDEALGSPNAEIGVYEEDALPGRRRIAVAWRHGSWGGDGRGMQMSDTVPGRRMSSLRAAAAGAGRQAAATAAVEAMLAGLRSSDGRGERGRAWTATAMAMAGQLMRGCWCYAPYARCALVVRGSWVC